MLTRGDLTVLGANPHGAGELSYRRHYADGNSTALAFLNTSGQNIVVSGVETGLAPGTTLGLVAGLVDGSDTVVLADGTVTLQLAPREGLIYLAGSVGEVPVPVITSYSIHYTKLYELRIAGAGPRRRDGNGRRAKDTC